MTKGLLISRTTKNTLHKKSLVDPNLYSEHYKRYRNIFNSLVRISKQKSLDENFRKHSKSPKCTWDLLKETTFGEKCANNLSEIIVNGETKNTPAEISEEFKKFSRVLGNLCIADNVVPASIDPESYLQDFDPHMSKIYYTL